MDYDSLLELLNGLPLRTYGYVALTATVGSFILRVLGFKTLAGIVRGGSLVVLLGGLYAKQQQLLGSDEHHTTSNQ